MTTTFYGVKGGAGTSTVAALAALAQARHSPTLLIDGAEYGDLPAILGLPDPIGPGFAEYAQYSEATLVCYRAYKTIAEYAVEMTHNIAVGVAPNLSLITRGQGPICALAADCLPDNAVIDCGLNTNMAAIGDRSVLVIRPCYMSLRRALEAPIRPTHIVLVVEDGRALNARDVADTLAMEVNTIVPVTPSIARAIDAGLLASRPPARVLDDLTDLMFPLFPLPTKANAQEIGTP